MSKLPNGYDVIKENDSAVLAENKNKREYVTWFKKSNGDGVFGGEFFLYDPRDKSDQEDALKYADRTYEKRSA